jgi:hypothetical protein
MEMSQGSSLHSYLRPTKMSIFKKKNREQEGRTGPVWGYQWEGEDVEKGLRRMNMVQYYNIYLHVYANGKMRPVETIPGMGGGE